MKELITILYGQEIEEFKSFTWKQKLAYIYFVVSFALFLLFACCNSKRCNNRCAREYAYCLIRRI